MPLLAPQQLPPPHDVLGIPEALTALEEVRVDLFEVLIGQIRRSEKMSVVLNDVVSQQADLLNGQRICAEIVTLAGQTVIPDKVRFTVLQSLVHAYNLLS